MLVLCAVFVSLGRWQWHRGAARALERQQFEQGTQQRLALEGRPLTDAARFQHVTLRGHYDGTHQFLLDNRVYRGQAGFEVLTPFLRPDGSAVLVDRGFLPLLGMRTQLPDVSLRAGAEGERSVSGRVEELPSPGLARGHAAPAAGRGWPKLTSFPGPSELATALGRPLERRIVLLDPEEPDGYLREWHPPGIPAERNWSYAVQWWGFAALALVFWVIVSLRPAEPSP